jgi:hypothetical protein
VSGWLLDTNVISELRRPRPSARERSFIAGQRLEDLFVSTVTFAGIRYGIETVGDPARRAELNDWLLHRVRPMFDQRALELSEDVMFKWRLIVAWKAFHSDPLLSYKECIRLPQSGRSLRSRILELLPRVADDARRAKAPSRWPTALAS